MVSYRKRSNKWIVLNHRMHIIVYIIFPKELAEAKRRVEQAQLKLTESQPRIAHVQRDLYNMSISVKRADQEIVKSNQQSKQKRDIVRRALKTKR